MGKIPKRARPTLYLAEWFDAFGVEPKDHDSIADAINYSSSYIKNLIQGRTDDPSVARRGNPSYNLLFELAGFFGIKVEDFRRPPTRKDVLRATENLSPRAREILIRSE